MLVSTELDEVIQLSDRIAVMYRGKIIDTIDGSMANKEILGLLMAGIHHPMKTPYARAKSKKEQIVLT